MQNSQQLKNIWLTDFCESKQVFVSIVMIQIVVIIYSLSFFSFDLSYVHLLSTLTLLSQWVGVSIIILLCKLRSWFNKLNVIAGVLALILLVIALTTIISQTIGFLDRQLSFGLFINTDAIKYLNIKLSLSSVIILLALIRYFYVQDQWHGQIKKLSEARLNALQARIKPHFLFNSLNSIASLISIDAERAEIAISDFASLMRRTFTHKDKNISIKEELTWVKQYLAIEKLRLDSRLTYTIDCEQRLLPIKIPILCIQPLVENAILHGIQPLENGGTIEINIFTDNNKLKIQVVNPYIENINTASNGIALDNIRQRLQLQYGVGASMNILKQDGVFSIYIGIPL